MLGDGRGGDVGGGGELDGEEVGGGGGDAEGAEGLGDLFVCLLGSACRLKGDVGGGGEGRFGEAIASAGGCGEEEEEKEKEEVRCCSRPD